MNSHYFGLFCDNGQDGGSFAIDKEDVSCPKCLEMIVAGYVTIFDLLAALAQLPAAQPQPETSRAEYVLTVGELVAMEAGTFDLEATRTDN